MTEYATLVPGWTYVAVPKSGYNGMTKLHKLLTHGIDGAFFAYDDGVQFELESDAIMFRLTFGV